MVANSANSLAFYTILTNIFDTHDGPESVFIWKSNWNYGKNLSPISLCESVRKLLHRSAPNQVKDLLLSLVSFTCSA